MRDPGGWRRNATLLQRRRAKGFGPAQRGEDVFRGFKEDR